MCLEERREAVDFICPLALIDVKEGDVGEVEERVRDGRFRAGYRVREHAPQAADTDVTVRPREDGDHLCHTRFPIRGHARSLARARDELSYSYSGAARGCACAPLTGRPAMRPRHDAFAVLLVGATAVAAAPVCPGTMLLASSGSACVTYETAYAAECPGGGAFQNASAAVLSSGARTAAGALPNFASCGCAPPREGGGTTEGWNKYCSGCGPGWGGFPACARCEALNATAASGAHCAAQGTDYLMCPWAAGAFLCACRAGYDGDRCETCATGYTTQADPLHAECRWCPSGGCRTCDAASECGPHSLCGALARDGSVLTVGAAPACGCAPGYAAASLVGDTLLTARLWRASPGCDFCAAPGGYAPGGWWVWATGTPRGALTGTCTRIVDDCGGGELLNVTASAAHGRCVCTPPRAFFDGFSCVDVASAVNASRTVDARAGAAVPGTAWELRIGAVALTGYTPAASAPAPAAPGAPWSHVLVRLVEFVAPPPAGTPHADAATAADVLGRRWFALGGAAGGFMWNVTGTPMVYPAAARGAAVATLFPAAALLACGGVAGAWGAALAGSHAPGVVANNSVMRVLEWDVAVACAAAAESPADVTWCAVVGDAAGDNPCVAPGDCAERVGSLQPCACGASRALSECPTCSRRRAPYGFPAAVRDPRAGDHRTCVPFATAVAAVCGSYTWLAASHVLPGAGAAWRPRDILSHCACEAAAHLDFACETCVAPYVRQTLLVSDYFTECIECPLPACARPPFSPPACVVASCRCVTAARARGRARARRPPLLLRARSAPNDPRRNYDPASVRLVCAAGYTGAACTQCAPEYKWAPWWGGCVPCPAIACVHGTNWCKDYAGCACDTGWHGPACDMVPVANGLCRCATRDARRRPRRVTRAPRSLTATVAARRCACDPPFAPNVTTGDCGACVVGYVRVSQALFAFALPPTCTPLAAVCGGGGDAALLDAPASAATGTCRCVVGYLYDATSAVAGGAPRGCTSRAAACGPTRLPDALAYASSAPDSCGCGGNSTSVGGACVPRLSLCGVGASHVAPAATGDGLSPGLLHECGCGPRFAPPGAQPQRVCRCARRRGGARVSQSAPTPTRTSACAGPAAAYVGRNCTPCAFDCVARNEVCSAAGCGCRDGWARVEAEAGGGGCRCVAMARRAAGRRSPRGQHLRAGPRGTRVRRVSRGAPARGRRGRDRGVRRR